MMRITVRWLVAITLCWGLTFVVSEPLGIAAEHESTFTGAKKCMKCHRKKTVGAQYRIWKASAHSGAFETLASEKALAEAKEQGLGDPQKEEKCLKCHTTAFAVMDNLENHTITVEEGVSCESCHGAGSRYIDEKTMEGISAGEIEAASVGLEKPTEESCRSCHRPEGNPFYKEFDFEKALKEIEHPRPK